MKYTLLVLFFIHFTALSKDVIRYPWLGNDVFSYQKYYLSLLTLSLEKSKNKYGDYLLKRQKAPMHQSRAIGSLIHNKYIDVLWTMTSIAREQELKPIRFPLLNGFGGCRIFLINQGEQYKFSQISTLEQLKKLIVGQGTNWPDTQILRANGFDVMTGASYNGLFGMLKHKRFDYFPRALHEPLIESDYFEGLRVEKTLLLQYPSPYFFFVNKENTHLAERLQYGLQKAKQDGSFDQLFNNNPATTAIIKKINLPQRKIFHLKNPLLSEQTALLLAKQKNKGNCL